METKSNIKFIKDVAADRNITLTDVEAIKYHNIIEAQIGVGAKGQDLYDRAKVFFSN